MPSIPSHVSINYTFLMEISANEFPDTGNQDVVLKDSVYAAIGLAAASLEQKLDFNAFLENTVVPEAQIQNSEYRLLRRRFSIILGQWVPIQPDKLNMKCVYGIFQRLLNKEDPLNDLVVRITAGRQLRHILEPYEFSPTEFSEYAPSIIESLMSLIQEIEVSETKMGLLETVRVLVVNMEHHVSQRWSWIDEQYLTSQIAPFSDSIVSLLPSLWEASGEEHLMKQIILTLLSSMIHSLKQESVRYHPLILPLIQSSVNPELVCTQRNSVEKRGSLY